MKTSGVPRPKDKANSLYNGFFRYSDRRMGLFVVDVIPLSGDTGKIIAAKLTLYSGDSEEYYCFITPEAYTSLKEWMDFHSSYGEKITGESRVMLNIWQATNIDYGARLGLATCPKKQKCSGIKRLLERALWEQGLRHPLSDGKKDTNGKQLMASASSIRLRLSK